MASSVLSWGGMGAVAAALVGALAGCTHLRSALGETETVELAAAPWVDAYAAWPEGDGAGGSPRLNGNATNGPLRIAGLPFENGIGVGGDAVLLYEPGGHAALFKMLVGIDDASPAPNGIALVELRADGMPVLREDLSKREEPVPIEFRLVGVNEVAIRVVARSNVFTDLVMPRMTGVPGLRAALEQAQRAVADQTGAPSVQVEPATMGNNARIFPCASGCIGMSNAFVCVVVDPAHGGRVIRYGPTPDVTFLAGHGSVVAPHPVERRIAPLRAAYKGAWKWKVEADGSLRLLSPPDAFHGIRWIRIIRLEQDTATLRVTTLLKNVSGHDVSWSGATEFTFAPGATVTLPADCTRSGQIAAAMGSTTLVIQPTERIHGLYPHNGLRVQREGGTYILFDELAPLAPGEHSTHEQYWLLNSTP